MWSPTNPRIKNLYAAIQRQKTRQQRPVGLTRFRAQWKYFDGQESQEGRTLVCDLHPNGLILYVSQPLVQNTLLTLDLSYPSPMQLVVNTLWSEYQSSSPHVQNTYSFNYRVGLQILFKDEEQQKAWQEIVEKAHKEYKFRERVKPAIPTGLSAPETPAEATTAKPEATPQPVGDQPVTNQPATDQPLATDEKAAA